ncbi:MAG: DUF6508 domain-containing protein [Chloroflexota bacterium]
MDLTERLRALADVLPMLEAPDASFGHWELPPPRDGVHSLGWFEFGPTAGAWRTAVAQGDWIVGGFDWRAWLTSDEGRFLHDDPAAIAGATPDQLARLLTAIVRSDRFVEGSIAGAFESGVLAAISRRASALLVSSRSERRSSG